MQWGHLHQSAGVGLSRLQYAAQLFIVGNLFGWQVQLCEHDDAVRAGLPIGRVHRGKSLRRRDLRPAARRRLREHDHAAHLRVAGNLQWWKLLVCVH
jgi:hypothetical protein